MARSMGSVGSNLADFAVVGVSAAAGDMLASYAAPTSPWLRAGGLVALGLVISGVSKGGLGHSVGLGVGVAGVVEAAQQGLMMLRAATAPAATAPVQGATGIYGSGAVYQLPRQASPATASPFGIPLAVAR